MTQTRAVTLVVAACLVLGAPARTAEPAGLPPDVAQLLKDAGAVAVAQKSPYGPGLDALYLGYGQDGAPVVGVAVRRTKTYKEAAALVAVTPKAGAYTVAAAQIRDVESFHGKSQTLAKDALKDITGRVFKTGDEARGLADAVTSATPYYKAIYVSYALMAYKVIEELSARPDWPRAPLAP